MEGSQVADINDKFLFSLSQLSRVFGPARETVTKYLNMAGVRPAGERKGHNVYHIGDAAPAILDGQRGFVQFDGVTDPDKLPTKERLEWFRSENERLKLERDQGVLIVQSQHEDVVADVVKLVLQVFEPLPDVLERRGVDLATVQKVEAAIDEARDKLADKVEKYGIR